MTTKIETAKLDALDIRAIGDTIQLAGTVYSGDGKLFLCLLPGETVDLPIVALEMDLDDWKKFLHQTDVLETTVLEKAKDGTIAKAIVRKSQRQISTSLMWRVFKRDGYQCRYCGNDNVALTVDHLITWETGGQTIEENLVSACKDCNKTRGNITYQEWLAHPHYAKVSRRLPMEIYEANKALVLTLENIPRHNTRRSR